MKKSYRIVFLLTLMLALLVVALVPVSAQGTSVFVNELHYDNASTDVGEGVEIAGPAGTDLSGWSVVFYNGNGGAPYNTLNLGGVLSNQDNGFGTLAFPQAGIQNGSPDGFALVDPANTVIQFLSYEGTFTAVGGPADGMTSTDIGVSESSSTPVGDSLQLIGTGSEYEAFTWTPSMPETFGNVNTDQTFSELTNAPIITACEDPLPVLVGNSTSGEVSASDEDGIVTSITMDDVDPPTSDISLTNVTPATEIGGTATATVEAADTTAPGTYDVTVGFANDDAVPQTTQCSVEVQVFDLPFVPIYDIQGPGQRSPYEDEIVATTGVVTLISTNGRDMWIQDPVGDGDPQTSDGIFVDDRDGLDPQPEVGDFVQVAGDVEEQQFGNALPLTRIDDTNRYPFEIISSGNPLPAPVPLVDLPDLVMQEGEFFWEPLEGMLVSIENAPVIAATNGFGEFGMLTKTDAKPNSGFFPQTQQILVRDLGGEVVDYNPERVMVDDVSHPPIVVMPGDRVRSLVGVVDYTFSMYKLQPVPGSVDVFTHNLPNLPASTRSGGAGNIAITSYNVENLFDLELNTPDVVDSFGEIGFRPDPAWGPPSTQNNTLLRNPDVCSGDLDPSDPFDPDLEWIGTGNDNFDDLGKHTSNCNPADSLIISEYIEGSSFNKALEIYNGTGAPVNLGTSGFAIDVYFNGSTSPGQSISLSGALASGDVYILANPSADAAIKAIADQLSGGVLWNGNDAIVLRQGGKADAGSTPTPEALEVQLTKLALSIEIELELPEIIVLEEIENQGIAQELGDRVNAATGTNYVATSFEVSDVRGIEPGFLWDANRVSLLDAYQMSGPNVEAAFGPNSASPGREPLVGIFDIEGNEVTIIGNHFKSKGGDDPLYGVNQPPIRVTETQRKLQAQVVRDFVNDILDEDPNALVMVAGDLNDFDFSEPGEGPDNPIAILEGSGDEVPLANLGQTEKDAEFFTFVFDGNSQVLDYILVSPALLDLFTAADMLHFNTPYPATLESDPTTPLSASDHDPLESRFKFK